MQVFLDLIEQITSGLRVIVGLLVLLIMGGILFTTLGTSYLASSAAEEIVAKAEDANERALEMQREAQREFIREAQLANEGWGNSAGADGFGEEASPDGARQRRSRRDDDWGTAE